MRRLWFVLLVLSCLLSLGLSSEVLKTYLAFDDFYADWDKYKAITKYCYIEQNRISPPETTLLGLVEQQAISAEYNSSTTEYAFVYTNPNGESYSFIFTNTNWSKNIKMFSVGRRPNEYSSLGSYDDAKETWNTLISANDVNRVNVNQLGKIDAESTAWLTVGGVLLIIGLAVGL